MGGWLEVVEGAAALAVGARVFASGVGAKVASRRGMLIVIAAIVVLVGLLLIFDSHVVDTPAGLWH